MFEISVGKDPGNTNKVRLFIVTISIAATYVIGNVYSANLTSMLARPGREKPIENLVQLEYAMINKDYKLFVEEHSSYYDLLQNGTGIYGRLWKLMKQQHEYIIDSVENGVQLIKNEKRIAVIAGRETLYFDVQRFGASNFHLSEKLNTAYSAIALQLGCPYIENINRILMGIFEAGILTKMTEDEYELLEKSQTPTSDDVGTVVVEPGKTAGQTDPEKSKQKAQKNAEDEGIRAINIKTLQGAFFVLLLGHVIAACVLLAEIRCYYYFKNKPNKTISFPYSKRLKFKIHVTKKRIIMWTKRKYNQLREEIRLSLLDYVD